MIDTEQAAYVRERIWTSDQDYFYWSSLRGEPFLEGDVLHFFDGSALTVVGFPLHSRLGHAEVQKQICRIVRRWLATAGVAFVNYYGPECAGLRDLLRDRWSVAWALDPDGGNVDSWVDYSDPEVLGTRPAREALRAMRAKNLRVTLGASIALGWEHIALLQEQGLRIGDDVSDLAMVLAGLTLLRSPATLLAEVRAGERLGGFALAHEFFARIPFLVVACSDRGCPGASDAVYVSLIQHYRDRGAERLNLGYTLDKGLLKYKTKWGGVRTGTPFVQVIWQRDGADSRFEGCLHWACRFGGLASSVKREPAAMPLPSR